METDGSNLKTILSIDEIDHTRTTSNNCVEMFEVLGIEAARESLISEIRMILDVYGIYIN
jgi:DNA-directed RNA polymerase II subunit RPB1